MLNKDYCSSIIRLLIITQPFTDIYGKIKNLILNQYCIQPPQVN